MIAQTERLVVRNWRDNDIELFHEINSDPQVMTFFPFRRNRDESREVMDRLRTSIDETGFGFFALERRSDGQPIGFVGLAIAGVEPFLPANTVEVGWRLATRYWGKGYATEAAERMLQLGFEERGLDEIVSFAVRDNHRSTAVMERIGMTPDATRDFNHPRIPDTHPHLKHHVLYAITSDQWKARQTDAGLSDQA